MKGVFGCFFVLSLFFTLLKMVGASKKRVKLIGRNQNAFENLLRRVWVGTLIDYDPKKLNVIFLSLLHVDQDPS